MTKKMNRIAAQGWSNLKRETEQKEAAAKQLAEGMETLRKFRDYLLNNNRGEATLALRSAVDDYAGFLTGDRTALHMKDFRELPSKGRSHD